MVAQSTLRGCLCYGQSDNATQCLKCLFSVCSRINVFGDCMVVKYDAWQ